MHDDLLALLRAATVRVVDGSGGLLGSGFFITPDTVLTAAHVVSALVQDQIHLRWSDEGVGIGQRVWCEPAVHVGPLNIYALPDLALVRLDAPTDRPCVMLSEALPSGNLLVAEGFTAGVTVETATQDTAQVTFEGTRPEPGGELIRCKGAQIDGGMSGGPLLDPVSGCVIGVVKARRGVDGGLFGSRIDVLSVLQPVVWAENQLFHNRDRRWRLAVAPDSTVREPVQATKNLLGMTMDTVASLSRTLPVEIDRATLHQTIWVKHVSRVARQDHTAETELASRPIAERFRWNPLRTVGSVTIVRGLPGYGKTWLLAYHTDILAKSALSALEVDHDATHVPIPLILDCSALGAALTATPDHDSVVAALVATLRVETLPTDAITDCHALVREAFDTGRLTLCLDGLDEVPERLRRTLKKALAVLAATSNTVVIATRPSMLPLLDDVVPDGRVDIEMLGFGAREASKFVASWLGHRPERHELLATALRSNASLRDIATVPLLLSFLCRLAATATSSVDFPSSKTALYQQVVDRLLSGRWRDSPSRNAIDPISPPDSERRLRLLAQSLGALQDKWRSSGVDVRRSDLSVRFARHPEHSYVELAAKARHAAWQWETEVEPTAPPADPVLWEFMFDGLLVDGDNDGTHPTVRVLHPSLRDFLLANYIAAMSDDERTRCLDRHRWFDVHWQEIMALAIPLLPDPGDLIVRMLNVPDDPWFTQLLCASQCVVEAPDRIPAVIVQQVVDALLDQQPGDRPTDNYRRTAAFSQLVRAGAQAAVDRGLDILATGVQEADELYLETVCAFAEGAHSEGLRHARELLADNRVRQRHRVRLITALASAEQQVDLDAIVLHLESTGRRPDLDAFLAALKPQSLPLLNVATSLLRRRQFYISARVAVAAALIECGDDGTSTVREMTEDTTTELQLRCRLFQLLINADEMGLTDIATDLLRAVGLQETDKSFVIEAMLRIGDVAWLQPANAIILAPVISAERKIALCKAVRDMGSAGVQILLTHIYSLPLGAVLPQLMVLLEVRDPNALTRASQVVGDQGVPPEQRCSILLWLFEADSTRVSFDVALRISQNEKLSVSSRMTVAVALAQAGYPDVHTVVRPLVTLDLEKCVWPLNSRLLATAGPAGRRALAVIAQDDAVSWEVRTESLIALGAMQAADAREVILGIDLRSIPHLWCNRLVYGLTSAGSPSFIDRLVGLTHTTIGAYEALRTFMYAPNASLDLFFRIQPQVTRHTSKQEPSERLTIDKEFLTSVGLSWNSENELLSLLRWVQNTLQRRVGQRVSLLMLPDQMQEFEAVASDNDKIEALRLLMEFFPAHGEVVHDEFAHLKREIKNGTLTPPPIVEENIHAWDVLPTMTNVIGLIHEWMKHTIAREWPAAFIFLETNRHALTSDYAIALLKLAVQLDKSWSYHEAHLFILDSARKIPISRLHIMATQSDFMWGHLVELWDRGDFAALLSAATFAIFCFDHSASCWFYCALGAAGTNQHALAKSCMWQSGKRAVDDQVSQGLETIGDMKVRFGWPDDLITDLQEALRKGVLDRSTESDV